MRKWRKPILPPLVSLTACATSWFNLEIGDGSFMTLKEQRRDGELLPSAKPSLSGIRSL
jgi:hypothetical protein